MAAARCGGAGCAAAHPAGCAVLQVNLSVRDRHAGVSNAKYGEPLARAASSEKAERPDGFLSFGGGEERLQAMRACVPVSQGSESFWQ